MAQAHTDLARGLARRARETSDRSYYAQAEHEVGESLRIEPDNFEALKVRVMILLGREDYVRALELARNLNKRIPDDVLMYGYVADASIALGEYQEAETATQWMLQLRRGNVQGLIRGAALRTLFGDVDGAVEWLTSAFKLTSATETEERAWVLTQIARLNLSVGKAELAEKQLNQALGLFPEYYFSLRRLAEARAAQLHFDDAAAVMRRALGISPHPRNLYALAVFLRQAGKNDEAVRAFSDFEKKALPQTGRSGNADRELVFYYADFAGKPAQALHLARLQAQKRHDVETLDAYAWALYVNGQYAEARTEMNKALDPGIRDVTFFEHAAAIAAKLKDQPAAAKYLRQALELNPPSDKARQLREALRAVE